MNILFKAKQRTPAELARALRDALDRLSGAEVSTGLALTDPSDSRRSDDAVRALQQAKLVLYGDGTNDPMPEHVAQFAQESYALQLIEAMLLAMPRLEFELRKVVVQIVVLLLQRSIGSRLPTVEYIARHPAALFIALRGYEDQEVALNTGAVLREMLQHEALAKCLLYSDEFYRFPAYIETTSFGVSCDAFANMKEALVRHRGMAAEYLNENYERFFAAYTQLLESPNYVTKRQSVKLLAELVVNRSNYAVMMRFVSDENNLKLVMNLLRDRSRNIQYEAFHVFKVFVANPKKTPRVEAILRRNRERLLAYLSDFSPERDTDTFVDEKQYVIHIIECVRPAVPADQLTSHPVAHMYSTMAASSPPGPGQGLRPLYRRCECADAPVRRPCRTLASPASLSARAQPSPR